MRTFQWRFLEHNILNKFREKNYIVLHHHCAQKFIFHIKKYCFLLDLNLDMGYNKKKTSTIEVFFKWWPIRLNFSQFRKYSKGVLFYIHSSKKLVLIMKKWNKISPTTMRTVHWNYNFEKNILKNIFVQHIFFTNFALKMYWYLHKVCIYKNFFWSFFFLKRKMYF